MVRDLKFETAKELVKERWGDSHYILEVNHYWKSRINLSHYDLAQYLIRSPTCEQAGLATQLVN